MKIIDLSLCTGDVHFPVIQALPTVIEDSFFKEMWNFLTYRRKWKVKEDYCLWVPAIARWVFVPKYFIFDGASVPKALYGLFSPNGMLLLGALPHDFGYRYQGLLHVDHKGYLFFQSYTKNELDSIFCDLCIFESGMDKMATGATLTLSVCGFLGWKENRKRNAVLMDDFPELFTLEEGVQNEI